MVAVCMVSFICLETTMAKGEPSTYFISAILLWVLFAVRPCTLTCLRLFMCEDP